MSCAHEICHCSRTNEHCRYCLAPMPEGPSIKLTREWLLRKKDYYLVRATEAQALGESERVVAQWLGAARAIRRLIELIGG